MLKPFADRPYRAGVGLVLVNEQNKIFLGKRHESSDEFWQMPQGGVEEGETVLETLMREAQEEIGTQQLTILQQTRLWLTYDLPLEFADKAWGGQFRGQRQHWFLAQFEGVDQDINIRTATPEFMDWRWAEAPEVIAAAVPFKRDIYQQVLREFGLIPLLAEGE